MTDIFTATNGTRIRSRGFPHPIEVDDSTFGWQPLKHYVGGSMMDNAMAEWYQHRRDVELGRWRDEHDPDMVVYPDVPYVTGIPRIAVLDERKPDQVHTFSEGSARAREGSRAEVARRYFAAHPEPKPWHDAKANEAWVITTSEGEQQAAYTIGERNGGVHFETPSFVFELDDPQIVHAVRLWPEGDDDE